MEKSKSIIVELSPAMTAIVASAFVTGQKRQDARFRYVTSETGAVEAILLYAVERLQSEWKSRDKYTDARDLYKACISGRPLTAHQSQLVAQAQQLIPVAKAPDSESQS